MRLDCLLWCWCAEHGRVVPRIELFFRQISELIDTFLEEGFAIFKPFVVSINVIEICCEDIESSVDLRFGRI